MNVTLVCEDSFEGIMTAVYDGWVYMNKGYEVNIQPGTGYTPSFFSEYVTIDTDYEKAKKVSKSIRVKISGEAYVMVYRACQHFEEDKADAIFGFLKVGYTVGAKVTKMLGNPSVMRVMELDRKVANEAHFFREFLRFKELKGNILYAKIEPKCSVIPFVSQHFQARFPEENWIIYDEKHTVAAVHPAGKNAILIKDKNIDELIKNMETKDGYEDLWKVFYNAIGIEARYNPKCQRNMMPLWYRKNMTEMT